jgi:hypothetical protein
VIEEQLLLPLCQVSSLQTLASQEVTLISGSLTPMKIKTKIYHHVKNQVSNLRSGKQPGPDSSRISALI